MDFDFFKDWWKKLSDPRMVSKKGSNPMFTYTEQPMMGSDTGHPSKGGSMDVQDMWERELDREWLSEAFQSAVPGAPNLPTRPSAPSGSGQPGPGSFETLFSMGDPLKKKRRSLEEIGRTA